MTQRQKSLPGDLLAFMTQLRQRRPSEDLLADTTQQQQQSPPEDLLGPSEDLLAYMSQQQQSGGGPGDLLALPGLGEEEEEDGDQVAAMPPRPPWWRRRGVIIAAFLLVLLILGIIFLPGLLFPKRQVQFTRQQVTPGNLAQTISATGPLQGATYNINFKGMGTIAEIDVKVGQHVTKGQVVSKLDPVSLQDAFNQAQAAYNAALATLQSDLANSGATQGQGGANISAAETTLSNARLNLNRVQAQGRATVAAAQATLTNTEAQLAATEAQGQASVAAAQTTLTNAEAQLAAAEQQANANVAAVGSPTPGICLSPTAIGTPGPCQQAAANGNVSVTTAQAAVNTAQAALNTAETQANLNDTNAQAAVNTAAAGLTTAQRLANLNNATAQEQVNAAQKSLNTAIANANLSDTSSNGLVNGAESAAKTALTQLNTALHNLQNATLTAPHAGTVTVINGTVGGTPGVPANVSTSITGTSGTFIQLVDATTLQAVADVNESDTTNLKVGDTAQFTVSAYGSREFTGVVSAISPNGTTVSNVVTFPVYVDVDKTDLQGATLLPGMTANLTINVAERIGVLLIPVNAVNFARSATAASAATGGMPLITTTQASMATVQAQSMLMQLLVQNPAIAADNPTPAFVLEQSNGQVIAKPVVLGLTDGTNYEVLVGLNAGETIIVGARSPRGGGGGAGGGGGGGGGG